MWQFIPLLLFGQFNAAIAAQLEEDDYTVRVDRNRNSDSCQISLTLTLGSKSAVCLFPPGYLGLKEITNGQESLLKQKNECDLWENLITLDQGQSSFLNVFNYRTLVSKAIGLFARDELDGGDTVFEYKPTLINGSNSQECTLRAEHVSFTLHLFKDKPDITLCNRLAKFLTFLKPTARKKN